ncbi:MAG TPA: GntR family transcriptional regulator, partial [Acetobacteraceae bacterium]|nr:GntR family transcriptional regulator [Acetobacteraceae bacterium]
MDDIAMKSTRTAPKEGAANRQPAKPVRVTSAVAGGLSATQPVLHHAGVALWRQIASQLQQAISAGTYAPGAKLPTEAELSQHFRVNRHTVRRALEELSRAALVRVEQGRGSFVAEDVIEYAVEPRTRFSEWIRK